MRVSPRFVVMNVVAGFALAMLAAGGYLTEAVTGPGRYGAVGVSSLTAVALALMASGQWARARWVADKMTVFALVGTVIGVVQAFTRADYAGTDALAALASIGTGIGLALLSTLFGLVSYAWLDLVLTECEPDPWDGDKVDVSLSVPRTLTTRANSPSDNRVQW